MIRYLPGLISLIFIVANFKMGLPKENRGAYIKKKVTAYAVLVVVGVTVAALYQYYRTGESWLVTLILSL